MSNPKRPTDADEAALRAWFGVYGPGQLAREVQFDRARFYETTLALNTVPPRRLSGWWLKTVGAAVLLVGLGSLAPVTTRSHATTSPRRAIHRTVPGLIRRPRAAIPATVLGKEEQLLSYQPRWIQERWLQAHRPPIFFSNWAPEDTNGHGWYYFYTGPHSASLLGENQVVLNVAPHLAWHGPIRPGKK